MSKSWVFLYFCLSFVGGIFINSLISIPQMLLWGFLLAPYQIYFGVGILGIILISVFWRSNWRFVVVGFCLLFLVTGIWRHQAAESQIVYPQEKKITFTGVVVKEPDIRVNNIKLTIEAENIDGKVLVTTNRYPEYQYGDQLEITGKLLTPKEYDDFSYKDYLAKEGIYSVMYNPEIKLSSKNHGNPVYSKILDFKNRLRESIYSLISPPQSSILGAMLLGDKRKISDEWKEKLNIAGVRHITAISGMHITILIQMLMLLLIGLGLWRQQAFYLTIFILVLYIIMIGAPPSAVRAGIMGGILLLAWQTGRLNQSWRAIIFAVAIMIAINPMLLRFDVGFQLSFLAVMGIIFLAPYFLEKLKFIPKRFNLRSVAAMTFAAQIFTLPILVYNFGSVSLVAPIINILIVPILWLILILGFITGILGMFWAALGQIFSWPTWLILSYVTGLVDLVSKFDFSAIVLENVHWMWIFPYYLIILYFLYRINAFKNAGFPIFLAKE